LDLEGSCRKKEVVLSGDLKRKKQMKAYGMEKYQKKKTAEALICADRPFSKYRARKVTRNTMTSERAKLDVLGGKLHRQDPFSPICGVGGGVSRNNVSNDNGDERIPR